MDLYLTRPIFSYNFVQISNEGAFLESLNSVYSSDHVWKFNVF